MPAASPTAAGTNDSRPIPADISIAGTTSDHTDAATITPAASPSSSLFWRGGICPFSRNTHPAPSTVPSSGTTSTTHSIMLVMPASWRSRRRAAPPGSASQSHSFSL